MRFYLGTPEPSWLRLLDLPLFISYHRLLKLKTFPRALHSWMQDSGGFTQVLTHGEYTISPKQYARATQRWTDEIGNLERSAIQDWMCESHILKRTGLSIKDHQRRTVESYSELRYLAPDVGWLPVIQGQTFDDYRRHLDLYAQYGDDLLMEPLVGVGSICRRQSTIEIRDLLRDLQGLGLRLHAFGMKISGLELSSAHIVSADSQSWSFQARRRKLRLPDCTHKGKYCSWCIEYAVRYRDRILRKVSEVHLAP